MAAGIAVEAKEAASQDAAVEVGPQLALDEASDRSALLPCVGEEDLEVLSDDFVEQGLLGLVALVLDGSVTSRDRALCRKTQVSCRSSRRRGRLAEAVPPPGRAPVSSRHEGQGRHRELRATDLLGTGVLDETAGRCFNARQN